MRYILGVDSGGTKTEALLIRADGMVLGWGRYDATEVMAGDDGGRTLTAVHAAIRQALGETPIDRLHVINTGNGLLPRYLLPPEYACPLTVRSVVESHTIFCLAPGRKALVALAGTGSHVAGRNGRGQIVILDGLGPYIGDWGGAVSIGLEGLRAAARSDWHPRHATSLGAVLQQAVRALDANPGGNMVSFMYCQPDRWKVAALARCVNAEAEAGDRIALEIIHRTAENMASVIYDVMEKLRLRAERLPLIGFGSVMRSRLYWARLREAVAAFAPAVQPARLQLPPVACHALSALSASRDFPAIRRNLRETLGPFIGREIPEELDYG
ncbi:MAG: BadF/BadG/BcrA/BcrD ATPase family protein [Armatimonadota bacterium]